MPLPVFRLGETRRLLEIVSAQEALTVTGVTATIWNDPPGEDDPVVDAGAGGTAAGSSDNEVDVYYLWTPDAAGDYTYQLLYTVGSEVLSSYGAVSVFPVPSLLDRWLQRVLRAIADTDVSEGQQLLSTRSLADALNAAVLAYSRAHPLKVAQDFALTANVWEYDLAGDDGLDGWVNEFSEFVGIVPRYQSALQVQAYLDADALEADEPRGKWRWRWWRPGTGDTARLTFTVPHRLTHTEDTFLTAAASAFEGVATYAAGVALAENAADLAARTEAPQEGAGMVSRRDQTARFASQGEKLMKRGRGLWAARRWGL